MPNWWDYDLSTIVQPRRAQQWSSDARLATFSKIAREELLKRGFKPEFVDRLLPTQDVDIKGLEPTGQEIQPPRKQQTGGGGLFGKIKGKLGDVTETVFRGAVNQPQDVLRPVAQLLEAEREHIGKPVTQALRDIPAPFVGVAVGEENPPGRTLFRVGPVQVTAGFGKDYSPLTQVIGENVLVPSTLIGGPLLGGGAKAAKAARAVTAAAKAEEAIAATAGLRGPVAKLTEIIKAAKPVRAETELLKSEALGGKVGAIRGILTRRPGEAGLGQALGQLKGELPKATFEAPGLRLTQAERDALFNQIWGNSELEPLTQVNTGQALRAALLGELPTEGQILLLENQFGPELAEALLAHRSFGSKAVATGLDIMNIPRAVEASWDASAPLRQGIVLAAGHPTRFVKTLVPMFKALSKKYAIETDRLMRADPYFDLLEKAGTEFPRFTGVAIKATGREEVFISRLAHRIPGIEISERIYVTFLNQLRYGVGKDILKGWGPIKPRLIDLKAEREALNILVKSGKATAADMDRLNEVRALVAQGRKFVEQPGAQAAKGVRTFEDVHELSRYLNLATGRGELGPLRDMLPGLNILFFAPRLALSRFQLPVMFVGEVGKSVAKSVAAGRIELTATTALMAKDLVASIGTGISILSLLKLSGAADVELDPRSTNFGKIRLGPTKYDFWGGYQPIARYTVQIIMGEKKTAGGDIVGIDKTEVLGRFLQSKLSPQVGLAVDVMTGRTYTGEPMEPTTATLESQLFNRLTPLFAQDIVEAVREQGLIGGFMAMPGGLGVGVQTYTSFSERRDQVAQKYTGKPWSDLQPKEQEALREAHPEELKPPEYEGAWQEREVALAALTLEQENADMTLPIGQEWKDDYQDRRLRQGAILADWAARHPEEAGMHKEAKTPGEKALNDYYQAVQDSSTPATGYFDKGNFAVLLDQLEGTWTPEQKTYVDENTGLRGTARVKEYRADMKKLEDYWNLGESVWERAQANNPDLTKYPTLADFTLALKQSYIDRGMSPAAAAYRISQHAGIQRLTQIVSALNMRWRLAHPDLERLLLKWGYISVPARTQSR